MAIVEGTVESDNRNILFGGHWKQLQQLKASAMGHSINHYSSEEVRYTFVSTHKI